MPNSAQNSSKGENVGGRQGGGKTINSGRNMSVYGSIVERGLPKNKRGVKVKNYERISYGQIRRRVTLYGREGVERGG